MPTPCLDFTRSPYIALFFAFHDAYKHFFTADSEKNTNECAAVYVIDTYLMALWWAGKCMRINKVGVDVGTSIRDRFLCIPYSDGNRDEILKEFFANGYPLDVLQFIPQPSSFNERMLRQQGVLLYDFRSDYQTLEDMLVSDKDDFEQKLQLKFDYFPGINIVNSNDVVVHKIFFKKRWSGAILSKLYMMGINATSLYMDYSGAVLDTMNSFIFSNPYHLRDSIIK